MDTINTELNLLATSIVQDQVDAEAEATLDEITLNYINHNLFADDGDHLWPWEIA